MNYLYRTTASALIALMSLSFAFAPLQNVHAEEPVSSTSIEEATQPTTETAAPSGTSSEDTEAGDSNADSATSSDGVPAVVDTGDAAASTTVVSNVNESATSATGTASTTASDVTVTTDNTLAASTTASSTTNSGGNSAVDVDGAEIETGNADVFAMLVSIFNIVVVNSTGGLIFLQNPIGPMLDLSDAILGVFGTTPGSVATSTCSLIKCDGQDSTLRILTNNVATVYNELIARATTGGNDAVSGGGTASVTSGNANVFGSILNFGNLQIINSRYLIILLNNIGDLNGNIVLPPADFFLHLSSSAKVGTETSLVSDNTAIIRNEATTTADTGGNHAVADDESVMDTGDADVQALLWNDVNKNMLGGRPICFIVSVGGTWNGDVVGLPEGFSREETPFGEIICGAGTSAPSTDLPDQLEATTTNYAEILNRALIIASTGNNRATGTDVKIETGDAQAFLQILNIVNQNIVGADWIFSLITVTGDWNGNLMFGNQDFWDAINAQVNYLTRSSGGALRLGDAKLTITKETSVKEAAPGANVDYTIRIKNSGDPVYHALLVDTLYDADGNSVTEHRWGLDTIKAGEELEISYTVAFGTSTKPGEYTNKAFISGIEGNPNYKTNLGRPVDSPVAEAVVTITGEALAVVEDQTCRPLLKDYIRYGEENTPTEVTKLQYFLTTIENQQAVPMSGEYDETTFNAVRAFQNKYAADVLAPWGVTEPTGFVYYTTQKKINELYCKDAEFPLSLEQLGEIDTFKSTIRRGTGNSSQPVGEGQGARDLSRVGLAPSDESFGSRLAATPVASAAEETDAAPEATENADQVAAVGATPEARSIFSAVRNTIRSVFSWVGL